MQIGSRAQAVIKEVDNYGKYEEQKCFDLYTYMWLHLNVDYEPIALLGKKNEVSEVYAVSRMKPVYLQRKYKGKEEKINIVGSWKKYCNNNIFKG